MGIRIGWIFVMRDFSDEVAVERQDSNRALSRDIDKVYQPHSVITGVAGSAFKAGVPVPAIGKIRVRVDVNGWKDSGELSGIRESISGLHTESLGVFQRWHPLSRIPPVEGSDIDIVLHGGK